MRKSETELLAPVGGKDQLRAAVQNGTDAVYLGGSLFNARINADNFDTNAMLWALDYAHLRNVKVYVAMNTLLWEEELRPAAAYARFLYEAGVDALITQDWGLADILREELPDLPLHLSTQGTIYNVRGVQTAASLGFERVVLARELSLQEIKDCADCRAADIEVFVHGALCMCYSGQCQMSRIRGGRSGNRGLCAQPCRLRYSWHESTAAGTYLLSPKDICTIDNLGELIEAGVKSFKIEGRMKSPEYVAATTSIYRKYIDLYDKQGYYTVSEEDRKILLQVFNRGGFTGGYLHGNPGQRLLSGDLPKHQGIYIGKVVKQGDRGLVDIELAEGADLEMGDGVEIRAEGLPGNIVTYIKRKNKDNDRLLTIGDIKLRGVGKNRQDGKTGRSDGKNNPEKLPVGSTVYKITDKALMEALRATFEPGGDGSEKNLKRESIEAFFVARIGEPPMLTLTERESVFGEPLSVTVCQNGIAAEQALNHSLTEERVKGQLVKAGNVPFAIEKVSADIQEGLSLPLSAINALRREALDKLAAAKVEQNRKHRCCSDRPNGAAGPICSASELLSFEDWSAHGTECKGRTDGENQNARGLHADTEYIPLYEYMEAYKRRRQTTDGKLDCKTTDCKITGGEVDGEKIGGRADGDRKPLPYIYNVSKGRLDKYIEENFDDIVEACRDTGIAVGNLSWIMPFVNAGIKVYGDYGLNITNSAAEQAMEKLGVKESMWSLELCDAADGDFPLMITEHIIGGGAKATSGIVAEDMSDKKAAVCTDKSRLIGELKDFDGRKYPVLITALGDKSIILSGSHPIRRF